MQLSETIKLYPTKEQYSLMTRTMETYISTVNGLVFDAMQGTSLAKYTSKDVTANLPSALINQCIRDAKSIVSKHYKFCHKAVLKNRSLCKKGSSIFVTAPKFPVLKKPCCYINNQNFRLSGKCIEFPVMINGKSKRISVATRMTDRQSKLLTSAKHGTMRIIVKGQSIIAQIVYDITEPVYHDKGNVMEIGRAHV